jgi:predicted TIM-barrel fold metal-dependent hydrolase
MDHLSCMPWIGPRRTATIFTMTLSKLQQSLFEAMEKMEIIDAHEHLPEENVRLEKPADVFTLFSHYTRLDLFQAGMSQQDYQSLFDRSTPLEVRWKKFAPFWEQIRWTCFSRPALVAAEKFYGVKDINEKTYQGISAAIQQANTPGIYQRVLRKACNIRTCLTNAYATDVKSDLLIPVLWPPLMYDVKTWEDLCHPVFDRQAGISSLDDYLEASERYLLKVKAEGAVAFKMLSLPHGIPDRQKALECFGLLKSGAVKSLENPGGLGTNPLRDYLVDEFIKFAGLNDMVIAVHTGFLSTLRHHHAMDVAPLIMRHRDVRFDVYHVGYPRWREPLTLAKCQPNVWVNFCGTYLVSGRFAQAALDEAIDLLPSSKIIAFGGDYGSVCGVPVEKVYGHLVMAREVIARVLAKRIEEGQLTQAQALDLARQWFWDNPKELYRLNLQQGVQPLCSR